MRTLRVFLTPYKDWMEVKTSLSYIKPPRVASPDCGHLHLTWELRTLRHAPFHQTIHLTIVNR